MLEFRFVGVAATGEERFDWSISDLQVVAGYTGPVLVSVVGGEGGLVTWSLESGGAPEVIGTRPLETGWITPTGPQLALSGDDLVISGVQPGRLGVADATGGASPPQIGYHAADIGHATVMAAMPGGRMAMADGNGAGMVVVAPQPEGGLSVVARTPATAADRAGMVSKIAVAGPEGAEILLAASAAGRSVTSFTVSGDRIVPLDTANAEDGLWMMVPTDLVVAQSGGQTFAVVASSPDTWGAAGTLSVLRVGDGGSLTVTDHVLDTRDSRFGQVQTLASVQYNGIPLVVAGGGDDGLSLFALASGGRLVHLDSFEDTRATGLTGVTALELAVFGDRLHVIAASGADAGVTALEVNLGDLGATIPTAGNDILCDGQGADTLQGGEGRDIYVFGVDGQTDVVRGFDPSADRLDLTGWPMLYDAQSVTILPTGSGATITFRNETLILESAQGRPLDPEAVRAAISLEVNRVPLPSDLGLPVADDGPDGEDDENTPRQGTDGNDMFAAQPGDDTILGGAGADTVTFAHSIFDVRVLDVSGDRVTVEAPDGVDVLGSIDVFEFADGTLDFAGVASLRGREVLEGTAGEDVLEATEDNARILGLGGDDTLTATNGADILDAGPGDDRVRALRGADSIRAGDGDDDIWGLGGSDTIEGGAGHDYLRGGREEDLIRGGDGEDSIRGQRHSDTIHGGDGDDNIKGGGGNDVQHGGAGHDFIKGGTWRDYAEGGTGNDKVSGNRHDDTLLGGEGNDKIIGGGHDDRLVGGDGDDFLKGGSGADTFVFARGDDRDKIADFSPAEDTLELDAALTGGMREGAAIVASFARIKRRGIELDFGDQDTILLSGLSSLAGLSDAIEIL